MTDPAAAPEFFKTGDPLGDGRGHVPSVDAMWRRHNTDGTSTVLFRQQLARHVVSDFGGAEQMWQRYDFGGAITTQAITIEAITRQSHNYIGHNYIGHNYKGHYYIGHKYRSHNEREP